jgi:hypothetical protein
MVHNLSSTPMQFPWARANLNYAAQALIISTSKSVINQLNKLDIASCHSKCYVAVA